MTEIADSQERRPKRWPIVAVALVCIAATAIVALWKLWPSYDGPVQHVIVISLDTTRADCLGCYGNRRIRTPRIDELANESMVFTDYATVVTTTLASHTSLFTGKYAHTHGVPRNGFIVNDDNVMLAEVLKAAGFYTAGFLGSFALDSRFNFAQGFEHFDQNFDILVNGRGVDQNQRRAESVTDAVIDYLDREGVPRNLFLFVHYFDAHAPYNAPAPYGQMYADGESVISAEGPTGESDRKSFQRFQRRSRLYAGEISYMDHHVGRLLDDLKRRGILDNALLIVTSDHGENLGDAEQSAPGHGWSTYQVEVHAVCLVRLPRAARGGTRVALPVASIDILPSVLSYLGLPIPVGVEGEVIDLNQPGGIDGGRVRFSEATKPWEPVEVDPRWYNIPKPCCVREGSLKYIRTLYQGREELYDLATDPYEHANLLASPTPEVTARAAELRQKLRDWVASGKPLPSHFDPRHQEDTMRRLQAMGYLGGEDDDSESEGASP